MAGKRITLTLTLKEAEALDYALGNTLDFEDVAENVFSGSKSDLAAAIRAGRKLEEAIHARTSGGGCARTSLQVAG